MSDWLGGLAYWLHLLFLSIYLLRSILEKKYWSSFHGIDFHIALFLVWLCSLPQTLLNFPSHRNHIETLNIENDPCMEY